MGKNVNRKDEGGGRTGSNGSTGEQNSHGFSLAKKRASKQNARLWLEAIAGCLRGQAWEVGRPGATLGRASDNNLSLADKEMSRRHSKVEDAETRFTWSREQGILCYDSFREHVRRPVVSPRSYLVSHVCGSCNRLALRAISWFHSP